MAKLAKTNSKSGTLTSQKSSPAANVPAPLIDRPLEGEFIIPGHYAVKIAGLWGKQMEVSIGNGPWHNCRYAGNHYWFDWHPTKPGNYDIVARLTDNHGQGTPSKRRTCTVIDRRKLN